MFDQLGGSDFSGNQRGGHTRAGNGELSGIKDVLNLFISYFRFQERRL
jgi:hypothetical protein